MPFTFSCLFWALSLLGPNYHQSAPLPNPPRPYVAADSSIYHEFAGNLNNYLGKIRPEKLYLQFDRTLFRPGETLWFNAYLRNAADLRASDISDILYVELYSPQGAMLQKKDLVAENGLAPGEFDLPENLPGGMYKIKAYTNWMRNSGAYFERNITLQKVVLPRVNLKFQFERKAFGPGDEVIARLDAFSLDNKPLAKCRLDVSARIADQRCYTGAAFTDATGRAYIRFKLPDVLNSSDGLLNIQLEHEGQPEAISRSIPIVLNHIDLQFFPEGGDLVAGLPCRVAFKALNEFGKPADVEGEVLDDAGNVVADFSSFHDGMGAFNLQPAASGRYKARLLKPVVTEANFALPEVLENGYRLHVQDQDAAGISVEINSNRPGFRYLIATCRDSIFYFKKIASGKKAQREKVPTAGLPAGIVYLTLLDSARVEHAERLVFVNRNKNLQIDIKPDRDQYLPRDKVRLDISVRDAQGAPAQGNFSLAVVDGKLLSFADDKQGHLLASLLLEQDVKGTIEEPNFYFDAKEPKAAEAMDYLLMTQGWRRFNWETVVQPEHQMYAFQPERARIAGTLFRTNGKPWENKEVRLHPNGPEVKSDEEGRFVFYNPDLSKYWYIEFNDVSYTISGFHENIVLHEYPPRGYKHNPRPTATGMTVLSGKVIDDQGEALISATIKVFRGTDFIRGTMTDYNGDYRLVLDPGKFDVEVSYPGYMSQKLIGVRVLVNTINPVDFSLVSGNLLGEVTVSAYKVPLIQQDKTQSGQALTSAQIRNLPTRSVNAIAATTAGIAFIDGGAVNIKGGRSKATNYYIDGIRVPGTPPPVQDDDILEQPAFALKDRAQTASKLSRAEQEAWGGYPNRRQFARAREFYVPPYGNAELGNTTRTDFRSTIYWNPKVQTDAKGKAQVEFYTSDAITNFNVVLEGISEQGIAGRQEQQFFVQKPLSIDLKTPASVIAGDVVRLQIALSNKTKSPLRGQLKLQTPAHFKLSGDLPEWIELKPEATRLIPAEFTVGQAQTTDQHFQFHFSAEGAQLEDVLEIDIKTLERGFPVRRVISGTAMQNMFNINLNEPVPGSVQAKLSAYPNPLGDVQKGMERMIRQPSGCFEQVSSSNYPNLLVLDLMRQSGEVDPGLESRAFDMLASGYKQLTAYECKDGGFDWWGRSPAHEGLTAYGILQFQDMAKVFKVDPKLTERSVKWLLSRRDGMGGWQRRADWHGWQSEGLLGAYIAWAVSEAGFGNQFAAEIEQAYKTTIASDDPYQLALMANALLAKNDPRGPELVQMLLRKQDEKGSWIGQTQSIMGGRGECLRIETTALGALALMKHGQSASATAKAMEFIANAKNEYGYGSTQSTVLALKALVTYAKLQAKTSAKGILVVQVDGRRVAELPFSAQSPKAIVLDSLEQYFRSGQPRVEVFFEKTKTAIPFDIEITYASRQPRNAANCPFDFQTKMSQASVKTGSTVRLSAKLQNTSERVLASPMIVLGIPAGLSLQPWQLKQLVEQKKCDFYELWDGFAVFHFETLPQGESRQIDLDLRADIAGAYEAPAAQAFLYYENDQRQWSKPERVQVLE